MRQGQLSEHFEAVALKYLSAVEAHPERSNQHEFNGVAGLQRIFGTDRQKLPADFAYLGESEDESTSAEAYLTWYDAREFHPSRTEYRLYFPSTPVSEKAVEGDLLVIGRRPDGRVLVVITPVGTTSANHVLWLFGLPDLQRRFRIVEVEEGEDLDFAARFILERLGVEIEHTADDYLDIMLERFDGGFPTTREFSAFARETVTDASPVAEPDPALMAWLGQEEALFRTLERHLVGDRIREGFGVVDEFISYSLSVQNRRKARAGRALEHHLEEVFRQHNLCLSREAETENRAKPDFLFPGIKAYRDETFPPVRLTMLGAKSSCKDRWRQVLTEAARIRTKHLLTLEPGISVHQTSEMQANGLQLVLPRELHETYAQSRQREWLLDLEEFIRLVRDRQPDP